MGHATNDDAAILKIDGTRALAQTVDFFTPIVDDPRLFGAIAAANSISDIYAMGATPILGIAVAAFPTDKLPLSVLEEILAGGAEKAAEAGFPVGGGHTIIDDVPKYGLAVTGIVDLDRIVRNSTAREGDVLFLSKPIGNGILVSAHRAVTTRGRLRKMFGGGAPPDLDEAIRWMTTLNRDVAAVMVDVGVSAATDVTGYGLLGHLLEMTTASGVGARIEMREVPLLEGARSLLEAGFVPAGTLRNRNAFEGRVRSTAGALDLTLLCDAQTSGGLLMAVPEGKAAEFRRRLDESGLFYAKIGVMTGTAGLVEIAP